MKLSIKNLSKTYSNGVVALDNISLEIPMGMFGLLGPNGAGKSTLMRTLATLQEPDSGTAHLGDIDIINNKHGLRKELGYLPQEFGVYPNVSAYDLLNHLAILKGVSNKSQRKELISALLERVNLYDQRKKSVSNFSGGMRQRFGIAQALIGNPKLVIVDEPTAGLDPGERNRFYNLLSEIGEEVVVILSTHIVEDVRELCNSMAIINHGKLLFDGKPSEAIDALNGKIWSKKTTKQELGFLYEEVNIISKKLVAGEPLVHAFSHENPGFDFVRIEPNLEDVFFSHILGASLEQLEKQLAA